MPGHYDFIDIGREIEVEAVRGGRRSNEFSTSPASVSSVGPTVTNDENVVFRPLDDILETEERLRALDTYVPFAERAFSERGLSYPFMRTGDTLSLRPGRPARLLALKIVELNECCGIGGQEAKDFELRATKALHRFIGGEAVVVGAPRRGATGPRRAVSKFRSLLRAEVGEYARDHYPPNGDFGADAFFILGRPWGGPIVFVQVKNRGFDPRTFAGELLEGSDSMREWFGRRFDQCRRVVTVCAVNTILTLTAKEAAFEACLSGSGYHVIDCVDILCAETTWARFRSKRDRLHVM